ncbi:hypothetical protein WBG78_14315 [Chryseolinea sp. T2]|uniref:hypothetical protein n=1 Tax=Chryseolinea sp. T2 TaxID=3129255 RepID=UPI0030778BFE
MQYVVGQSVDIHGFVTSEKFIANCSLSEIEKRLGFHQGRLMQGAAFLVLSGTPSDKDFELRGYSNVADHRFKMPSGLDVKVLKRNVKEAWEEDQTQLIKVVPRQGHNPEISDDIQYPPGHGVPQWKLTSDYKARVVAVYSPNDYVARTPYRRNHS